MKTLTRIGFTFAVLSIGGITFAGAPTGDQAGYYTGTIKSVQYNFDGSKSIKVTQPATMVIEYDGTATVSAFGGDFPMAGQYFSVGGMMAGVIPGGGIFNQRLSFKGTGTKVSLKTVGQIFSVDPSATGSIEFKGKFKRLIF